MQFQYVSDIHLEFLQTIPKIEAVADILLLAGDIGDPKKPLYKEFLLDVGNKFKFVILISGNHEYYGKTLGQGDDQIRQIVTEINSNSTGEIIYLQKEVFHIPDSDISVFGGTFWTHIADNEKHMIASVINDYAYIRDFTVTVCREQHATTVTALQEAIATNPSRRWIVMSHHIPKTMLVHQRYRHLPYNSAFASNILIADDERIVAWVYGHTHLPTVIGKFYCNPIGYKGENTNVSYTKTFVM